MMIPDSIAEATTALRKIIDKSARILIVMESGLGRSTIVSTLRAMEFHDIVTIESCKVLKKTDYYDWILCRVDMTQPINIYHMMHAANYSPNKKGVLFSAMFINEEEMSFLPPMFDMGLLSMHSIKGLSKSAIEAAIFELMQFVDKLKNDQLISAAYYFKFAAEQADKKYLSIASDIAILLGDKLDSLIGVRGLLANSLLKQGRKADFDKITLPNVDVAQLENNKAIRESIDGEHKKAETRLKKLITDMSNGGIYAQTLLNYNLALMFIRAGEMDEALLVLHQSIADLRKQSTDDIKLDTIADHLELLTKQIYESKSNKKPIEIDSELISFTPANKRTSLTYKEKFPDKCLSPVLYQLNTTANDVCRLRMADVIRHTSSLTGSL